MAKGLRADNPVADLVDGALAGSEADTNAAETIVNEAEASSTDGGVDVELQENTERTTEAAEEIVIEDAPREDRPRSTKRTKAEIQAELEQTQRELAAIRHDLQALQARSNVNAIDDLAATFVFAIEVSSSLVAAQRGPHWKFETEEAKPVGEAWAVVAAPYAERLQKFLPLALALGVTWRSLKPRLDRDAEIVAQQQGNERDAEQS